MRLVHVVGGRYVPVCLPQEVRFNRFAFEIDAEPSVPLVNMGKAFPVRAMPHDRPTPDFIGIIEWIILVGGGERQAESD
jgi:hypothetical protein